MSYTSLQALAAATPSGLGRNEFLSFENGKGWSVQYLNCFVRIFRSVFGCCRNTHLKHIMRQIAIEQVRNELTIQVENSWKKRYPQLPIPQSIQRNSPTQETVPQQPSQRSFPQETLPPAANPIPQATTVPVVSIVSTEPPAQTRIPLPQKIEGTMSSVDENLSTLAIADFFQALALGKRDFSPDDIGGSLIAKNIPKLPLQDRMETFRSLGFKRGGERIDLTDGSRTVFLNLLHRETFGKFSLSIGPCAPANECGIALIEPRPGEPMEIFIFNPGGLEGSPSYVKRCKDYGDAAEELERCFPRIPGKHTVLLKTKFES